MRPIGCPRCRTTLPQKRADGRCVACGDLLSGEKWVAPPPPPPPPPDPYAVYPARQKGIGTRRWIEMVGVLHRLGFGRLRLACSWENAGPAPVWFGVVAPGSYFRRDHGAILARHPFPEKERAAWESVLPNDAPMFSDRRCGRPDYPWPGFLDGSAEAAAGRWVELYPQLAAEGRGEDAPYVAWYDRMLRATAPTGLIAAYNYWEPPPGYLYVSCGPGGLDRFELPPIGFAAEAEAPTRGEPGRPANNKFGGGGWVMAFFRRLLRGLVGRSASPGAPSARSVDPDGARRRYERTPIGSQSPPQGRRPVDRSGWKPCHACGRLIPVVEDRVPRVVEVRTAGRQTRDPDGTLIEDGVTDPVRTVEGAETWTYVCPFCRHCHVGTPGDLPDIRAQARCHECGTDFGALDQCPRCSFPRGWVTVPCPHCGSRQPVYAPHWVVHCDMFTLECVTCESTFDSWCIC